jgi:hypothetical protein
MIHARSESPKCAAELRDGVIYLRWARGAVIDEKDALAALREVDRLVQRGGDRVLVDMATTAWLSCKARRVFAHPCKVSRVALLGSSPVDRVIVKFFLDRVGVPCPGRFFTSLDEAIPWLTSPAAGGSPADAKPGAGW